MKKVLISMVLASVATVSLAYDRNIVNQNQQRNYELQNSYRHHNHEVRSGGEWVGPLIIGGIIGSIITRESQTVYVQPAPVYIQHQPVYVPPPVIRQEVCGDWREIQTPDGRIYRERSCYTQ